jgi:nucleotide-binding universal stress UspA family protein
MRTAQSEPVVVGVNSSPDSDRVIGYAVGEARCRRRPLRLVHGFVPVPMFGPTPLVPYDIEAPLRTARSVLDDLAREVCQHDPALEVSTSVEVSSPARLLVEESREACLVVLGSRERSNLAALLTGSVGAQVAAHAHCPVVVLRGPVMRPGTAAAKPGGEQAVAAGARLAASGPIVVGVDGSTGAHNALDFAFDEAAARGTGVIAVYAWGVPPGGNLGPITRTHYDEAEAQEEADRLLSEATAGLSARYPDVPLERRAVHSFNPAITLMEVAATAALIVVGPRGRGGFASLLLGSVADSLVHHADRPVAIVR